MARTQKERPGLSLTTGSDLTGRNRIPVLALSLLDITLLALEKSGSVFEIQFPKCEMGINTFFPE